MTGSHLTARLPRIPAEFFAGVLAELRSLRTEAMARLSSGKRPWSALCASCLACLAAAMYQSHSGRHLLTSIGDARASLTFPVELARLPVASFLPTSELPLLGAVAQLLLVFGVAELLFGSGISICVAALGQLLSSLAARLMISWSGVAVLGLSASQAAVLDTGPSGMTTALGAWLLARTRSYLSLGALVVGITAFCIAQNNLDGREHFVACLSGIGIAGTVHLFRAAKSRLDGLLA